MVQQPVIAKIDPDRAENMQAKNRQHDAGPAEKPPHEREQREKMAGRQPAEFDPSCASRLGCRRSRQPRRNTDKHALAVGAISIGIPRTL
jgi:hypothetical protein